MASIWLQDQNNSPQLMLSMCIDCIQQNDTNLKEFCLLYNIFQPQQKPDNCGPNL